MGLLNSPTPNSGDGGADDDALPDNDEQADGVKASRPAASWTVLLYLALSLLIAAANGCATAALNFVSMQSKALFKSSKIVTTMLLGSLFGRIYTPAEYAYMLMVVFASRVPSRWRVDRLAQCAAAGIALLSLAVLADSLVPNLQQKLLQGIGRPKQEMVFHTNWCARPSQLRATRWQPASSRPRLHTWAASLASPACCCCSPSPATSEFSRTLRL